MTVIFHFSIRDWLRCEFCCCSWHMLVICGITYIFYFKFKWDAECKIVFLFLVHTARKAKKAWRLWKFNSFFFEMWMRANYSLVSFEIIRTKNRKEQDVFHVLDINVIYMKCAYKQPRKTRDLRGNPRKEKSMSVCSVFDTWGKISDLDARRTTWNDARNFAPFYFLLAYLIPVKILGSCAVLMDGKGILGLNSEGWHKKTWAIK